MDLDIISKEMNDIEFKLTNMSNSFNYSSGKYIEYQKQIDKLINRYNYLNCERVLMLPFENILYTDITEGGLVMSINEFKSRCGDNEFSDDTGYGFYVHNETTNLETENIEIKPSWVMSSKYRRDFSQIVWYSSDEIDIDNQASNTKSFEDIEEEF